MTTAFTTKSINKFLEDVLRKGMSGLQDLPENFGFSKIDKWDGKDAKSNDENNYLFAEEL